jgi:hypothetical protein
VSASLVLASTSTLVISSDWAGLLSLISSYVPDTCDADFRAMAVSPRGEWVYTLGEDNVLYCFNVAAGKLEHIMQVTQEASSR